MSLSMRARVFFCMLCCVQFAVVNSADDDGDFVDIGLKMQPDGKNKITYECRPETSGQSEAYCYVNWQGALNTAAGFYGYPKMTCYAGYAFLKWKYTDPVFKARIEFVCYKC